MHPQASLTGGAAVTSEWTLLQAPADLFDALRIAAPQMLVARP
jgi:hypothetical protein